MADAGQFQVQKGVLPRIHIDGHDLFRAGQGVVQGIAAGGGNDQDRIVGHEVQCLLIQPRIFPAGVVDQVVAMNQLEDLSTGPFTNRHKIPPGIVRGRAVDFAGFIPLGKRFATIRDLFT